MGSRFVSFEWDEGKRRDNIRKHGIDFLDAALVFEADTIEWIDDREDYGEDRMIALGLSGLAVLRVTYTLRGDTIRIISAQKASKHDRKKFFEAIEPG